MTIKKTTSTTITFNADANTSADSSLGTVSLELDTNKNTSVYGADKTTFEINETAYLLVTPHNTYTLESSAGTLAYANKNIAFEYSETLIFTKTNTENLAYYPMPATPANPNNISWEWIGKSGGTPLFSGKTVSLPDQVVGALRVSYKIAKDRLTLDVTSLSGEVELPVICVVTNSNGDSANLTVTYIGDISTNPVPVDIEVLNFCTREIVAGASVYIDDVLKGVTDDNGLIYVGELVPGQSYDLKVTADTYTDSDKDVLNNDSFTIETE